MQDDVKYLEYLKKITNIPSPIGLNKYMNNFLLKELNKIFNNSFLSKKVEIGTTNSGVVFVYIKSSNPKAKSITIATHCDKVGLMVSEKKSENIYEVVPVGSIDEKTLNGQYATLITRDGQEHSGTLKVSENGNKSNIEIVLDIEEKYIVDELNIQIGDYVLPDNHFVQNGFYIKSRYLDNSLSVAMSLVALSQIKSQRYESKNNLLFLFTNREEVGAGYVNSLFPPADVYLALDVAVKDLNTGENQVGIVVKDYLIPYDYEENTKIINFANSLALNYFLEVSNSGGTDVTAAVVSGCPSRFVSFGPIIENIHGVERTHLTAVQDAYSLFITYILN